MDMTNDDGYDNNDNNMSSMMILSSSSLSSSSSFDAIIVTSPNIDAAHATREIISMSFGGGIVVMTMAAAITLRLPWCPTPGTETFNNQPTCYATSLCY